MQPDKAARFVGAEYKAHVSQLEKEICQHLASQGGIVSFIQFALVEVVIDRERLHYFKTLIVHDRNAGAGGFSFARRQSDVTGVVLPVSAQKPFARARKMPL